MNRIYKLLGYLLLGIGAYALINANNTDLYAQRYPLGQANSPATQQQTPRKRKRHTITLVLNQLSDLKVEEGQRINVGDLRARSHHQRISINCKLNERIYCTIISI